MIDFFDPLILKNLNEVINSMDTSILFTGISDVHGSYMASLLYQKIDKKSIIIVPNEIVGEKMCNDVNALIGYDSAVLFPAREFIFDDVESASRQYEYTRLSSIHNILSEKYKIVIIPVDALQQLIIPKDEYIKCTINISVGDIVDLNQIIKKLIICGYSKNDMVDGIGQFSVRGEILDIFSTSYPDPIRINFWDNEIDTIYLFDCESQRRIDNNLETVSITPARELLILNMNSFLSELNKIYDALPKSGSETQKKYLKKEIDKFQHQSISESLDKYLPIIYSEKCTILDYLKGYSIFIFDPLNVYKYSQNYFYQIYQEIEALLDSKININNSVESYIISWEKVIDKLYKEKIIMLTPFSQTNLPIQPQTVLNIQAKTISNWDGNIISLIEDIQYYIDKNFKVIIFAGTEKMTSILQKELNEKFNDYPSLSVVSGSLSSGMEFSDSKLVILTCNRIEKFKNRKEYSKYKPGQILKSLEDLSPGDYVVHAQNGIGIFDGIKNIEMQGILKDYMKIKYLGDDILYVPVTQLDLVSRYIGSKEDLSVHLNKLGSSSWQKTKQKVKSAVKDIAKDLIKLHSERINSKGFAFSQDNDWQHQFEETFEYEETDDQIRCIDEIKNDMQLPIPMDRLICGDVGFGKTEVALRAAFKAVMDSKQVAILVPTTILALQHYNNIISRMQNFPINIELFSRAQSPAQQKKILKRLESGEIEIIVGTHRLIQDDVKFKDLGLAIIDEEQRFGVAHKEKFKQLKKSVDVLSLSATPIPRTLNMAINGIRDMSVIEKAPQNRYPVQTYVIEYNDTIIALAILKEMKRGGMVFYLHNEINSINKCAQKINTLVPSARIYIAHGRMSPEALSNVWEKLLNREADILVCTTIIETGIDIPFCNTLIIENADKMGLSQLYQLRGRIGRSNKRAYAYMTFREGKILSDIATKRLNAIKEFTRFGSGFKIALRDLEIRGAGNILGSQQHGHMESVGYDMYLKILGESIAEERGQKPELLVSEECYIDVQVNAYLPEKYILNLSQRIDIYKRIAMIKNNDDYIDLVDELIDRFGEPPKVAIDLLDVSLSRNLAIQVNVKEILQKKQSIYFYQDPFNILNASMASKDPTLDKRISINAIGKPYIEVKLNSNDNILKIIKQVLFALGKENIDSGVK